MKHRYSHIFLFSGFFLVIALFFIIRSVGEQKTVQSHAAASSILTFTNTTPQITPGGTVSIDVGVNPGNNAVSLINLIIGYDSSKLNPLQNGFAPTTAFPQTLDGPIYNTCSGTQCTMYIALSVGNKPTNAITTTTKVATLNFQAVSAGDTQLIFDTKTQIFSVAASDQANENVLSTASPLTVTIGGTGGITPTLLQSSPTPTGGNQTSPTSPDQGGGSLTPTTNAQNLTPTIASTTINLQLALPGIGINGGNLHPLHPLRTITFYLYNIDTGTLLTKTNSVVFDGSYFVRPIIDLGQIPSGNYQVFIVSPQFLMIRLSQGGATSTIPIQNGQAIQVQPNTLIAGDIAPHTGTSFGDNTLDILDYNALLSCYGNKYKTASCLAPLMASNPGADFDDNGIVDAIDYNILLRGLSQTKTGDTIPGR